MTDFRPKISPHTVQELHRMAVRENRTLTNMTEIALRTGLHAKPTAALGERTGETRRPL
jgi:hypothetical protein